VTREPPSKYFFFDVGSLQPKQSTENAAQAWLARLGWLGFQVLTRGGKADGVERTDDIVRVGLQEGIVSMCARLMACA